MEIFREENWDTWRSGCFTMADFKNLYGEKDRWLLTWTAVHGNDHASRIAMHRLGISVIPEVPVNTDDEKDDLYFLYLVLNEQVKRESDFQVLRKAAFCAPFPMNRFAFCRLTGASWTPDERKAYSYRTYSCGLKNNVVRKDIEDLCREMIIRNGPMSEIAGKRLEELSGITDAELERMASDKTERSFDNPSEEWLRVTMRPKKGYSEEEDLELKICGIFDAFIMLLYEKEFPGGSVRFWQQINEDAFSENMRNCLIYDYKPKSDVIDTVTDLLSIGGRLTPDMTPDKISKIAWSVCKNSRQHSFFLYLAYWYGLGTKVNDDLALKMLSDAADRGHMFSFNDLVNIYSSGKYVHKNVRLALDWQEKKVELCRQLYEEDKNSESAIKDYESAIRELGSLLMKEGYAKRAKQQFRKADQLAEQA